MAAPLKNKRPHRILFGFDKLTDRDDRLPSRIDVTLWRSVTWKHGLGLHDGVVDTYLRGRTLP